MNVRFGAELQQRDGDRLGTVSRAVYDPATGQMVSLVGRKRGFLERGEVVVPAGTIDAIDEDIVYLEVSKDQFHDFEDFGFGRNVAPPPSADNIEASDSTDPMDVGDVPAVGAASGIETIAFVPIVTETLEVPGGYQVLEQSTSVWSIDGEIGTLEGVEVDEQTNRMVALLVAGADPEGHFAVPISHASSVQTGTIVLTCGRTELEGMTIEH